MTTREVDDLSPLLGRVPTTRAMVEAAYDHAIVAAAEAQVAWRRYREAIAADVDVEARRAEHMVTAAQDVYAWSVYHSARRDWLRDNPDDLGDADDAPGEVTTGRHLESV